MSESTSDDQKWTPPPAGTPCWIEIPAVDVPACKKFYSGLFPSWDFKPATEIYTEDTIALWNFAGPPGLGGGIRKVSAECKTSEQNEGVGVTVYHFVDSIEEAQKRVEELGGKTCSGKEAEGDNGWYMHFKDVAGNRFGVYQLRK